MAKTVMIQGTMSNVGKSILTAALCRIFHQDGYAVAPFKSQNMALNSFITKDGSEIGRAQALQAEAAGISPSPLMNPILLKPTTDAGSQVIVNGRVKGNMSAMSYLCHRKEYFAEIMNAYRELDDNFDIIVIEGAGSPVELNLKHDDIVNMGLARHIHAPVLLVGDIDRGGIFAQMMGTLQLMMPEERSLVKGLLVNQFRGDRKLFSDGEQMLSQMSGIPVLGVVPYVKHALEEEDSLSERLRSHEKQEIDIGILHFPKLSNYTDFDVFRQYPNVSVRFIQRPEEFCFPDMLILPGTKNTISDMQWLRETGLEVVIKGYAAQGKPIFGICGGYQMLGNTIADPSGCEGGGSVEGLGLLPCETVFSEKKYQTQISGVFKHVGGWFGCLSGAAFTGYELHHGKTMTSGDALTSVGGIWKDNVCGCYVHGIFDSVDVSERIVSALSGHNVRGIDRAAYRSQQLDLLADVVRKNVDISMIYRIMEENHGV